ncbi:MAG: hypothetical protein ACTTKX_08070 [Treponema sp.]
MKKIIEKIAVVLSISAILISILVAARHCRTFPNSRLRNFRMQEAHRMTASYFTALFQ